MKAETIARGRGAGRSSARVAICGEIELGCDLVALGKFGQLEALGTGLTAAFAAAVERDIPILTAVSPIYNDARDAFSTPFGIVLPAVDAVLDHWRLSISRH